MSSSSNDSASRIREQANKTLRERAQQRETEQKSLAQKAAQDLADARIAHRRSQEAADAQLDELCVTLDTLIEFIVLNHGEIPPKLAEIIAARQEQRILESLPSSDFIAEGVKEGDTVTATLPLAPPGSILKVQNGTVGWVPGPANPAEVTKDLLDHVLGVKAD